MVESIRQYFSGLPDPRHRRGRRHRLDELVIIAILAVICGADNWQEVAWSASGGDQAIAGQLQDVTLDGDRQVNKDLGRLERRSVSPLKAGRSAASRSSDSQPQAD
jgi:hypothetical protein